MSEDNRKEKETKKDSKKRVPTSVKLRQELRDKHEEFVGKDDLFGATLLTNPSYISSPRNIMFTSHLRQFVNLINPDFPRVFTGYENLTGKYSSGSHLRAKSNAVVYAIIPRYMDAPEHSYLMITYDEENDRYDIIDKQNTENLTEKFGFEYNTENIDSKKEGARIEKDEVLYKTHSFDEHMNYRYGKNVRFMYLLENNTIDDAFIISESLSNSMASTEVETVRISLNDNDIFCNIYGDADNHQGFPNIGEKVKSRVLAATRRIKNSQLLYDLKRSNLRRINFGSDVLYYNEGTVTDITVFSNKTEEELEENSTNKQLLFYLRNQKQFFQKLHDVLSEIRASGSKYSKDINYWFKRAELVLDDEYKWRETEDSTVFSNMVIEITVSRRVPLKEGQKIAGRYGNKGVISKIRPDNEMPYLENGERVDIIFNTLGVINRLNSQQLFEQSITFITNRTREKLATIESLEERRELLLRVIWYFSKPEEEKLREYLDALTEEQQERFFDTIQEEGIYVHIPPMWEERPIFDRIRDLRKEFDWIKPYTVYINKFGRRIPMMQQVPVGEMYIIKLKQSSKKNFSVRATGSISQSGVPVKSMKAKNHQELHSKTPIRIGGDENNNLSIGVSTKIIAQLHMYYRSSPIGRRSLAMDLMSTVKELEHFSHPRHMHNRNVEMLQAILKSLGFRLQFADEKTVYDLPTEQVKSSFSTRGGLLIGNGIDRQNLQVSEDVKAQYADGGGKFFFGTPDEFQQRIAKETSDTIAELRSPMYIDVEND